MKIALHGSYFGRNFGDTLIIKIVNNWLNECGEHEVVLPFVSSEDEAMEIGSRKINENEWQDIDCVVFAGGGYFGEPNSSFLKKNKWYIRNWKRHLSWSKKIVTKKKIIIGIGIGPLSNTFFRKKVFSFLKKFEKVIVRDQESFFFLKSNAYEPSNLILGADIACSLGVNNIINLSEIHKTNKIALHLPIVGNEVMTKFSSVLNFLYEYEGLEIIRDIPVKGNLINEVYFNKSFGSRKINVLPYPGIEKFLEQIASYKLIITSKLHVGIVATNLGVPVYSLPNHIKTIRYYNQINYSNHCNPMYNFDEHKHASFKNNFNSLPIANIPNEVYENLLLMKNELFNFLEKVKRIK